MNARYDALTEARNKCRAVADTHARRGNQAAMTAAMECEKAILALRDSLGEQNAAGQVGGSVSAAGQSAEVDSRVEPLESATSVKKLAATPVPAAPVRDSPAVQNDMQRSVACVNKAGLARISAGLYTMRGCLSAASSNTFDGFLLKLVQGAIDELANLHAVLPSRDSERAVLVTNVGECCRGTDPMCAGGCLVERALQKRASYPQSSSEALTLLQKWWEGGIDNQEFHLRMQTALSQPAQPPASEAGKHLSDKELEEIGASVPAGRGYTSRRDRAIADAAAFRADGGMEKVPEISEERISELWAIAMKHIASGFFHESFVPGERKNIVPKYFAHLLMREPAAAPSPNGDKESR